MAKKSHREVPQYGVEHVDPPYRPIIKRPGDEGSAFRTSPLAEPKAQRQLLGLLGTSGGVVIMGGILAVVVVILLVLLVTRA